VFPRCGRSKRASRQGESRRSARRGSAVRYPFVVRRLDIHEHRLSKDSGRCGVEALSRSVARGVLSVRVSTG
jgi:hypothetical protein